MIKKISLIPILFLFSSCQLGYYFKSAKNQFQMMSSRVPVNEALQDKELTEEQRRKIVLSQKARDFAFQKLKLKETSNYSSFINLHRPYVTWVVQAAYKWEMKTYEWSYPFVGNMPYKGFFNEADAKEEAEHMEKEGYDSYVRGVSAYSTLGWFEDSVLSSMLRYKDHDLVNTIIHEIVHTTLYIKNNAEFNERLAVFIGNKGTEMFYAEYEGPQSQTLQTIKNENEDDVLFSNFVNLKLSDMNTWYQSHGTEKNEVARQEMFDGILSSFQNDLKPKLKTNSYNKFEKEKMNNARMSLYKTYMQNLDDFELVYKKLNSDLLVFIETMKTLEKSKNPSEDLKKLL